MPLTGGKLRDENRMKVTPILIGVGKAKIEKDDYRRVSVKRQIEQMQCRPARGGFGALVLFRRPG